MSETVTFQSIAQLHDFMQLPSPKHPLISLIPAEAIEIKSHQIGKSVDYNMYMISSKDKACAVDYGLNTLDYNDGVLTFSAPGQLYTANDVVERGSVKGWMLFIHPDLFKGTFLANQIHEYSFFNYDVFEALHLSAKEEELINSTVKNIVNEYSQRIDNHSQRVIVTNLALLLDHSLRFYERQFNTRTSKSQDIVTQFKQELNNYFAQNNLSSAGIPSTAYFAEQANLSTHYFSDLLKKETGRTPKDFINQKLVNKAKSQLKTSNQSINEIAYELGFNYPHYFTRLFKSKTGQTPLQYRNAN